MCFYLQRQYIYMEELLGTHGYESSQVVEVFRTFREKLIKSERYLLKRDI